MLERLYFVCRVRLDESDAFVVWYSDERDGFVVNLDGSLLSGSTLEDVAAAMSERNIALVPDEIQDYDFDRIKKWCIAPRAENVDCTAFLNAWNFFDDLAGLHENANTLYSRLSRKSGHSYDKLFWGNNLPSMTPPDEHYKPVWEPEDLDGIRRVMEAGLVLLRKRVTWRESRHL